MGPTPTPLGPCTGWRFALVQRCDWLQAMCVGDRLAQLIQHALQMRDELLFKVLRNISQQEDVGVKERFVPYIDALVGLLKVGRHAAGAGTLLWQPCLRHASCMWQTALALSRCASRDQGWAHRTLLH